MKVTCKQCGKEFELSNSEIDFYKSKNLELPKRCKECRELNKQNGSKKNDRKNDGKKEKTETTETKKTEQPMEKKSNLSYSSNVEQSKGPKKTVYATVAAVIVAVVAFVGSYFGLDFDTLNVSNSETNSTVQTGTMEHKQEDATVQETEQNRSSSDTAQEKEIEQETGQEVEVKQETNVSNLTFRNDNLLQTHYEKHGVEMGFSSAKEYEAAANKVLDHPDTLHKTEAEDGDAVYYLEATNEFVIVSTDGYLRTYYNPSGGLDYYNRQ